MVLTEAEEECVHAHGVDAEEAVGDEIGAHHHRLQGKTQHQDPMTLTSRLELVSKISENGCWLITTSPVEIH